MPEPHIGTLREKPLHAALKRWYARDGDLIEQPVDGFIVDLVRDDLLIEVQTRGFSSMKRKVATLLELGHRLRIVHPIAVDRWIVRIDEESEPLSRRRSPRHGDVVDVFAELVSFPQLMASNRLEVHVVLTAEDELRRHTPGRSWRRKGWSVVERRLVEVRATQLLRTVGDLAALLPEGLPTTFTTADLAEQTARPRRSAQQMAYCLRHVGAIHVVGKRGNAVEYRAG